MLEKFKQKVENKIAIILLHGKSIKILEKQNQIINTPNTCLIGLNSFDVVEDNILNKIKRTYDIIFHLAIQYRNLEQKVFKRKLQNAISKGSLIIGTRKKFLNYYESDNNLKDFYKINKTNILLLDDIIDKNNVSLVDNQYSIPCITLCYIIYLLSIIKVKKIILFGCDGSIKLKHQLTNHYESDIAIKRHTATNNFIVENSVTPDTEEFNKHFNDTFDIVREAFNITTIPEILNCSLDSYISVFPIITHKQVEEICH